jgi:arginyl-tRNA synthetase
MNFTNLIKGLCQKALLEAFSDSPAIPPDLMAITESTQAQYGHYQCNSAMKLTKLLNQNPRTIAEKLITQLEALSEQQTPALFSQISIAGPGFINFWLNPEYLSTQINQQLQDPRIGFPLTTHPLKIVIDYSSPNIAKEMHVGHLRSTVIGDCLARILRYAGHTVLGLNHVGDWGTQFGMLIAYIKAEHKNTDAPLTELVQWYKASKQRFDADPNFKKTAQQEVIALQRGDAESLQIWEGICEMSRLSYQAIYDCLGIEQLTERGESFYNLHLAHIIEDLNSKGLLSISDGAQCIYLEGYSNREGDPLPLIVKKSDGGYNYATTDIASLKHRVEDEKADWLIYVTDAGQAQHFEMVFKACEKAGYYSPSKTKIDHVPFGMVLGPDGKKFKTRSGDTEKLMDLLDVAIQQSKDILIERDQYAENPRDPKTLNDSSEILGINAIKYADLACHRVSDYVFSYEKMLKFEGNTAAFILYAYVRIQSIQRKTQVDIHQLMQSGEQLRLIEPSEIALGLQVLQFSETLEQTIKELLPSRLTDYLFTLAEKFHLFFHHCRVEGTAEQNARLLLCKAVSDVMHQGLLLLGLKPLERM